MADLGTSAMESAIGGQRVLAAGQNVISAYLDRLNVCPIVHISGQELIPMS